MKNAVVLALTFLLLATAAMAEPSDAGKKLLARTFTFKHKDADKAAALIKPLMTAEGSINLQPATNSFVVTDRPDVMKTISAKLAEFDVPPQQFRLVVRLVAASRVDPKSAPRVKDELKDVAEKLAMMRFNAFDDLGERTVEGKEGDPGLLEMESGYRADFRFGEYDQNSDTIKVSDFRVARLGGAAGDEVVPLLKTTLNLKLGQTVILGATKTQSQRALMIVVAARR
ncbi:MAG TPA: secretin N-terminal domain-containing protein [Thermoanaerobaculia bacterium]|nr:secretin N-terminal domain-containing protein [Thermoanaerobaculia bacterium]